MYVFMYSFQMLKSYIFIVYNKHMQLAFLPYVLITDYKA